MRAAQTAVSANGPGLAQPLDNIRPRGAGGPAFYSLVPSGNPLAQKVEAN